MQSRRVYEVAAPSRASQQRAAAGTSIMSTEQTPRDLLSRDLRAAKKSSKLYHSPVRPPPLPPLLARTGRVCVFHDTPHSAVSPLFLGVGLQQQSHAQRTMAPNNRTERLPPRFHAPHQPCKMKRGRGKKKLTMARTCPKLHAFGGAELEQDKRPVIFRVQIYPPHHPVRRGVQGREGRRGVQAKRKAKRQ